MSRIGFLNRRSNNFRRGERGWDRQSPYGQVNAYRERTTGMTHRWPLRVNTQPSSYKIAKPVSGARSLARRPDLLNDSIAAAGLTRTETGTKLYISNLEYGVSNEDVKELFSEVGDLKWSTVHYDQNGRPNGTAEVVFIRRSDAVAALKRYNNVQLDGKAMKLEIIGDNLHLPVTARVNVAGGVNGRERRTVVMIPKVGQGFSRAFNSNPRINHRNPQPTRGRGSNRGRGRGRGRGPMWGRGQRQGRKQPIEKSADDLDKELDNYHAEAMTT